MPPNGTSTATPRGRGGAQELGVTDRPMRFVRVEKLAVATAQMVKHGGGYLQWLVVEQNKTQPAGRVSHPCHIPFRIRPIGGVSAGTPGGRNPVAARITSSGEWAESGPTGLGDRRSRVQVSAARPWAAARVSTRWPLWLRYRLATRQHGLWVCRPRGGRWRRPCGVALMLHYLLHVLLVIALNRSQGAVT